MLSYNSCFRTFVIVLWTTIAVLSVEGSEMYISGWSNWIDRSTTDSKELSDEFERQDHHEISQICPNGHISDLQCQFVDGTNNVAKRNITCNVETVRRCLSKNNYPHYCLEYRIRFRCETNEDRRRRRSSPLANCNSWYHWVNENHPNSTNKNDNEHISEQQLRTFCPLNMGAHVSKVQCKDDRGEPFTGPIKDPNNRFGGQCTNISDGVTCEILHHNSVDPCPDFSLQFYCNCSGWTGAPPTGGSGNMLVSSPSAIRISTSSPSAIGISTSISRIDSSTTWVELLSITSTSTMTSVIGLQDSIKQKSDFFIFGTKKMISLVLTCCIFLIVLNCILLIVLHRRAMKYAREKWQSKVKPLNI